MLKRSNTFILSAVITISILAANTSAQDCDSYDAYGVVTDSAGKAISGARVEFLDAQTKLPVKPAPDSPQYDLVQNTATRSDGSYVISILGLPNIQNGQDFIFRVSAAGFVSHEEKVNIYLCGFKRDVKLVRPKPPAKSKAKTKHTRKRRPTPAKT
jgi:hypothetical protein